jgi:thiamine-phosphate pyrophosphorylase
MKSLYVTNRAAIGETAFHAILDRLRGAPSLAVQLREKDITDVAYRDGAREAKAKLGAGVSLWVNRRFDIALAAGADGVHLPANGLPPERVKAATPRGFRVGVSTHSAAEANDAIERRADLVVIGPIFPTPSKQGLGPPLGAEALAGLLPISEHSSEVYAIGGVDEERLQQLTPYRDRITGVAAIRMFQEASDPRAVAARLASL